MEKKADGSFDAENWAPDSYVTLWYLTSDLLVFHESLSKKQQEENIDILMYHYWSKLNMSKYPLSIAECNNEGNSVANTILTEYINYNLIFTWFQFCFNEDIIINWYSSVYDLGIDQGLNLLRSMVSLLQNL